LQQCSYGYSIGKNGLNSVLTQGRELKEALCFAVAAGTATTLKPGKALCQKGVFLELIRKIKLAAI